MPAFAEALTSPAARITLVMTLLFSANGILLPYLARWMEHERGLDGAEIGAVLSLSQLVRIFTGPAIALWADGARDRRFPIRLLATATLAAFLAFFFLAHDFPSMLLTGFLALTLAQGMVPFVEAATLRATAQGRISYGLARGFGSSAFIVAAIAGGLLISRFGLGAVVAYILCAYVLMNFSAWFGLKPDIAPEGGHTASSKARMMGALGLLKNPRFIAILLACGLIQAAHAFYYGFSTLVWRGQGVSAELIGLLWAFGVVMEVAFLWSLPLIERKLSSEGLIRISAGASVLRWGAMGLAPLGLLLWPLQALHALTFAAAHVAAMRMVTRTAPEAAAGMAQTLNAGVMGVFAGLATFASGFLYDHVGAAGYWLMAAMAVASALIALFALEPQQATPQV